MTTNLYTATAVPVDIDFAVSIGSDELYAPKDMAVSDEFSIDLADLYPLFDRNVSLEGQFGLYCLTLHLGFDPDEADSGPVRIVAQGSAGTVQSFVAAATRAAA
ncbi:MAG: hypothetical protein WA988_20935 [Candidatus Nanopelagicales bacterium]